MINVLKRKGLLTGKEVLDEMEVIVAIKGKELAQGYVEAQNAAREWIEKH